MAKKIKILLIAAAVFIAAFIALSAAVFLNGKSFIEAKLKKVFAAECSIRSVSLSAPLSINISDIKLGQLFSAKKVSFSPSIFSLFAGKIVLSNLSLVNPVLNLELSESGRLNLPKRPAAAQEKKGDRVPFYLTGLRIINGRVEFTDKKITPQGYKIIASGINADIAKQLFPPASLNTKFHIEADIATAQDEPIGALYSAGWIDFGPKNMEAALQIKELEITYFYPYYGNFISNKKVLSAKLTTLSDFKAQDNALTITTDLKLHDLLYAEEDAQKPQTISIYDLAQKTLDLFIDPDGNLKLQFALHTRLDNPRISIPELKSAVLAAAMRSLAEQPPQELIQKGVELYKQFKDLFH